MPDISMSSDKLRKYLAYYRKTLNDDPENIEARLRLAALFREMGRPIHAIEEYGTAAKLLASEGLPLEAIAACKAILELDPTHQETQLFLARLYAEVPEATGDSVRVARPVDPSQLESAESTSNPDTAERAAVRLERSAEGSPDDERAGQTSGDAGLAAGDADSSSGVVAEGAVDRGGDEATAVQPTHQQAALRERELEDDRQSFEVGVFDMESLGLEESSRNDWDDLDALDDFEEPDTEEVVVDERRVDDPSTAQREFRVSALPNIPLFSQLPRKVFVDVLDAMEHRELPAATEIMRPDDPESCLYVVVSGRVRVEKDLIDGRTVDLATMGEGEVFGEFRLLTGKGGRARVVAETEVELLSVSDEVIYRLGDKHPEIWEALWSFYYRRMLNHSLATSRLFSTLNREERKLVTRHFELDDFEADEVLFERGEEVDAVSLIVSGSVHVFIPDGDGGDQIVDTLEEGAFVGVSPCARELAATATVRARTDLVVYRMKGDIFRELLYGLPEVAEAVRKLVEARQSRTPNLPDDAALADRV